MQGPRLCCHHRYPSLSTAKSNPYRRFQGGNNASDQPGTAGRGQGTNLGEKLTAPLLLPPVQVMSVRSTTLVLSDVSSTLPQDRQLQTLHKRDQ